MPYTPQEAFDKVCQHIKTQGRPSVRLRHQARDNNDVYCVYRSDEGLSCAIGALIPDDEYLPGMESRGVGALVKDFVVSSLQGLDSLFLTDLQRCHDSCSSSLNFTAAALGELVWFAKRYDLDPKEALPVAVGAP